MLGSFTKLQGMVAVVALFGALSLLAISSSSQAEPAPLDEAPAKKDDADKPKEKTAVTVPSGTTIMIKTDQEVSSNDKAGRRFSAKLQSNLLAGDTVVAKSGAEVYGQVVKSGQIGRGIVTQHSDLVLSLTEINIDGTMYPLQTGSFSEDATSVLLKKRAVVVPAGSILKFALTAPLTAKK